MINNEVTIKPTIFKDLFLIEIAINMKLKFCKIQKTPCMYLVGASYQLVNNSCIANCAMQETNAIRMKVKSKMSEVLLSVSDLNTGYKSIAQFLQNFAPSSFWVLQRKQFIILKIFFVNNLGICDFISEFCCWSGC